MIWKGGDLCGVEKDLFEPAPRSCWECNGAHEYLKGVNTLHVCFVCGRHWVFDRFFDEFETPEAFEEWMRSKGLEPGDSTTKVDAGYRILEITLSFGPSPE